MVFVHLLAIYRCCWSKVVRVAIPMDTRAYIISESNHIVALLPLEARQVPSLTFICTAFVVVRNNGVIDQYDRPVGTRLFDQEHFDVGS